MFSLTMMFGWNYAIEINVFLSNINTDVGVNRPLGRALRELNEIKMEIDSKLHFFSSCVLFRVMSTANAAIF